MVLKKAGLKVEEAPTAELGLSECLLDRTGFLLNKAAHRIKEAYEERLGPLGLAGKHYGVLSVLEERGSITQHEIGKCVYVDRTTMVGIIDDLEKKGLVERKEHPTDRRSHAVYLTGKGKEALSKAHHLASSVDKRFLGCLSAKEQKELRQILRKLVVAHYSSIKAGERGEG